MQMLQIFNELAWLVHVGILDGVKKKSNSRRLLNYNKLYHLTLRIYLFLRYFFFKLNKKKNSVDLLYRNN